MKPVSRGPKRSRRETSLRGVYQESLRVHIAKSPTAKGKMGKAAKIGQIRLLSYFLSFLG